MSPQVVADQLRKSILAPPGAVTVWPWHEDDGQVTMLVVVDTKIWVDVRMVPSEFRGFKVRIEKRETPTVRSSIGFR
jgi:hypothetical protein